MLTLQSLQVHKLSTTSWLLQARRSRVSTQTECCHEDRTRQLGSAVLLRDDSICISIPFLLVRYQVFRLQQGVQRVLQKFDLKHSGREQEACLTKLRFTEEERGGFVSP